MCVSEALFSGKSNGTPMGTNSAPAIQFSNTFLYIDDLFSVNNEEFGDNINSIYSSELELKDTSTSQRMCALPRSKIPAWWQQLTFPCQHLR